MRKCVLLVICSLVSLLPAGGEEPEPAICTGSAMMLNVVPGFGLGSFLQGDTVRGRSQLIVQSVSLGGLIVAIVLAEADSWWSVEDHIICYGLGWLSIGSRVFGCIRALRYAKGHRDVPPQEEVAIGIVPSIGCISDCRRREIQLGLLISFTLE
jgi:hypothetical protein